MLDIPSLSLLRLGTYNSSMDKTNIHSLSFYQIYPRSFCDSNGDGIGDINGIISKLDYLSSLGVDVIWLSPIYDSPLDDMGYDVRDYYKIHKDYGTMEDFDNLLLEARKRNIKIVMDLVVNHTSDENEWFIKSKDPSSPYRDYYYWRKGKGKKTPNNWTSMFTGSAWEFDKRSNEYYLHLYSKKQPDLNYHNPKVIEEVEKILRFYLDKGVYGFRCDVINQIYKESLEDGKGHYFSGRGQEHYLMRQGNHDILRKLYDDVFSKYDSVVIGETYNVDLDNGKKFLSNHEMDMFFQFELMGVTKSSLPVFAKPFKAKKFFSIIRKWQENIDWNANYLENHDQLRSIYKFGDEKNHYLESAKALGLINLTLRGSPFIYQGEEIGMTNLPISNDVGLSMDVVSRQVNSIMKKLLFPKRIRNKLIYNLDRDNCRSPMQWDSSFNAGFTSSNNPWIRVNPNYLKINAKDNVNDPNSIFSFYKKLLNIRKTNPVLQEGDFKFLAMYKDVFAFSRNYQDKKALVIVNLGKKKAKNLIDASSFEEVLSTLENKNSKELLPYEGRLYLKI